MSSVKEDSKDIENLKEDSKQLNDETNSHNDICAHSDKNVKKDSFDSCLTDSHSEAIAQDCNNKEQNSFDIGNSCIQNTVIKSEENGAHSKTEKRRNVSLLRNEPPPLIHYLQDKEAPKIDDDNSPPQLLPEVIVTRTKLHREKSQTFKSQSENSFKVSIARNLQKSRRKLWMKYSSSLSDDQTSNESHEHFLSYTDISQCSSTGSGILKKGTAGTLEKQKKSKQSNHCEKSQRMGISPEAARTLPKFPSCNGTNCFSSDGEPQERTVEKCRPASSESGVEEFDRECSIDLGNEIDYESWLTETEDEEEDDAIFVVPPQISTGKEERDRIDGIEFLGFETEHDMVEFTKIELDYRGECQQNDENITHSDDGLDMMDDSFNYSEPEAHSASQAIIPTKTKDITKIKGWRTKTFAINNNPSEGQCSSSSIGPYEDDDGFVSCDIKIEEDASLDLEEQGDLWSGGEQDLFVHDAHLPIESYSVESVKKDFPSSIKTERKSVEGDETFSGFEDHTHNIKNNNVLFESLTYGTGRYPKRMSTTLSKVTSPIKKEVDHIPSDLPYKVPKKRGRKPKTIAEKRLMLQLANQYKRRRKRGRPKGSGKKSNNLFKQQRDSNVCEVVYNLRNKLKRGEHILDKSNGLNSSVEANNNIRNMEITEKKYPEMEHLNDKGVESIRNKINSKLQSGQRRYLLSTEMNIRDEDSPTYFSYLKNSLEEKSGIIDSSKKILKEDALIISNITPISTSDTLTTSSTATSLPVSKSSCSVSLICPSKKINSIFDSPTSEISNASTLGSSGGSSGGLSSTNTKSLIPSSSGAITTTTNSVAITTAELPTTSNGSEANNWKNINENDKIKQSYPCNISLVDRSLDKSFEYGLILSTGVRRPLVTLAMDQLKTLRENNHHVDEHWAKFAASIVVTKTTKTPLQSNTVILPVRALRLPFMSFTQKPVSKDPYQPFSAITRPQSIIPKFDPMTGTSVRVRCPRPLTQVGVRTIPSIFKRQNLEHDYHILGVKRPRRYTIVDNDQNNVGSGTNSFLKNEIEDDVRKVVEDLVDYVERREARDLVIHEEPRSHSLASESSNVNENIVLKRKKGPMIRELTRLDVNVIEMWDARNQKCTEEYCKLGCVCESLECCKPAIQQHCGKEECMFTCECEPKSYKRGDSRQHTLLSPLTLLTIPQQNRRILAKEEKEFQQTVIRAKHETIVVGSNGSSRRKREIKLPGRYRDSYVALGKDYGLVDFKISSDENIDPSARRLTRIAVVNNRELIQGIPPKTGSGVTKVPWEVKVSEMKLQYGLKECYVKLKRSDCALTIAQKKEKEMHLDTSRDKEQTKTNSQMLEEKSRNMAVKSTTLLPNVWYDPKYFAARTAPINTKLLKRYRHNSSSVNQNNLLVTSNSIASTIPSPAEVPPNVSCLSQNINIPSTSDFMLDDGSLSFGKIESVTTLSEEQFQKGDLTFGIEQFQTHSVSATMDEMKANTSDKNVKGKTNTNISIDKIANLLNRKIRELKEKGGNVSFPSGNEESIHLLQWPVLKSLFQSKSIQLWYYNGGSKLVITSTKLRPDPSFVNLNDVSEQQYKQLPPIVSDLFKSDGKKNKQFHRDIYALLHFDGKHVELVGTIFKNRTSSEVSHGVPPKNLKLVESKPDLNKDKLCVKATEKKSIVDVPSSPSSEKCFILKRADCNSPPKSSFTNHNCFQQGKSHLIMKSSNANLLGFVGEIQTEKQKPLSVVKSSNVNMKLVGQFKQGQSLKEDPFSEMKSCIESISIGHTKTTDPERPFLNKSAINLNSQRLSEKEKPHLTVNTNEKSPRYVNESHEEKVKPLLIMKSSNLNNSPTVVRKINGREKHLSIVTSLNEQVSSQELGSQTHSEKEKSISKNYNLNSPESKSQIHIEKERSNSATKLSILCPDLPEYVKQVEKSPTSVKKLSNLNLQSLSPNQISKINNATCAQNQLSVSKCDGKSGTRIRKLKTIWQSTKVQTAEGENVPIPLPSCAGDSRWFVLNVSKPFDVLHITSKHCSARYKHISETIKMASSHKKTVRLPLQVSNKNLVCDNPNQPKFGIYAVPHVSSYVFIGPYGINEDPSITKSVLCDGKYRTLIDLDDDGDEPPITSENLGQDYSEKVVSILRKLCKRPVEKQKEIHSWLYTKRNCENEASKAQKENSLPQNNPKNSSEKTSCNDNNIGLLKMGICNNNIHNNDVEVHVTTVGKVANSVYKDNAEKEKERSTDMTNAESQSNVAKQENSNKIKHRMDSFKVSVTGKVPQIPSSTQSQETTLKESSPKRKADDACGEIAKKLSVNFNKSLSYETNNTDKFNRNSKLPISSQLTSTPNLSSSTKSPTKKKSLASTSSASKKQVSSSPKKKGHSKKTLTEDSQKSLQPQPVAGWLVPSFSWIGCIPCNYEGGGGLFFSHPVSGVKMMFSNLESTQLWLDRLFQSAILYIPKQLFVTWSLQTNLGKDGLKQFDSSLLNGNYMMTTKGIFDIDKLVATDAESYGLKPIEVLRLQDKKCRRDLELGLYQLKRALDDNGALLSPNSSKQDVILKAVTEIQSLQSNARDLEKEHKKWKNSKHKSLLYLYNKMKGLPINIKRDIVQKLKIQYDQAEDKNQSLASDVKDSNDGLNFSMARYCGGAVIFPHKSNDSDLEDYLSEYDEEDMEDSCEDITSNRKNSSSPLGESEKQSANVETTKNTVDRKRNLKTSDDEYDVVEDDDESVSISVVTSQNVTEVKDIINSDEITVTCLNNSSDVKNSLCVSTSMQSRDSSTNKNENMATSNASVRSQPKITLKPLSALTSPVKAITEEVKNSAPYTLAMKRKITESSYDTVPELAKKMKVHIPGETSQLNSGFDGLLVKKYKTIKIDSSVTQGNDSQTKKAAVGSFTESTQVSSASSKVTNPNTLFVNVVSPTQSKIVPLHVEDKVKGCVQNFGAVHVPSSSSLPNRTLKIIHKDMKPVYVQGPRRTLPFLVTSHTSTAVPTSCSVLSSTAVQPSLPVLSVKKVSKDSIPPGVEPRPATFLPPPLVPITDKKQSKLLNEHTTQLLTAIAPLPTLIKMVDGMPAEKGS
ncbi:hypothetical protein R5R35_007958 [Gryllus longicercus]|uniref:MGA conserved domain-containing protein n=1 Tax=Gryllus longicercus TaxID=2509291 RepID=A0AAN9YXK9_9ORTH